MLPNETLRARILQPAVCVGRGHSQHEAGTHVWQVLAQLFARADELRDAAPDGAHVEEKVCRATPRPVREQRPPFPAPGVLPCAREVRNAVVAQLADGVAEACNNGLTFNCGRVADRSLPQCVAGVGRSIACELRAAGGRAVVVHVVLVAPGEAAALVEGTHAAARAHPTELPDRRARQRAAAAAQRVQRAEERSGGGGLHVAGKGALLEASWDVDGERREVEGGG